MKKHPKGRFPAPVYEAHYIIPTPHTCTKRVERLSFWAHKKEINPTNIREWLRKFPPCSQKGIMIKGFVEYDGKRFLDWTLADGAFNNQFESKKQRITAKEARELIGKILACCDGFITDETEQSQIAQQAREIAL